MPVLDQIKFIDNPAAANRPGHYQTVEVDIHKIMKSWRSSLYSYEWLRADGQIKALEELPESEQERRRIVEDKITGGKTLEQPVLGIGLLENVEIGSGRATLLTLAALGVDRVPVHIPHSSRDEFAPFLAGSAG